MRAAQDGARTNDLVSCTLRQFLQSHRIPRTAAMPLHARLGTQSYSHANLAQTFQRLNLMQHALNVDGSYA